MAGPGVDDLSDDQLSLRGVLLFDEEVAQLEDALKRELCRATGAAEADGTLVEYTMVMLVQNGKPVGEVKAALADLLGPEASAPLAEWLAEYVRDLLETHADDELLLQQHQPEAAAAAPQQSPPQQGQEGAARDRAPRQQPQQQQRGRGMRLFSMAVAASIRSTKDAPRVAYKEEAPLPAPPTTGRSQSQQHEQPEADGEFTSRRNARRQEWRQAHQPEEEETVRMVEIVQTNGSAAKRRSPAGVGEEGGGRVVTVAPADDGGKQQQQLPQGPTVFRITGLDREAELRAQLGARGFAPWNAGGATSTMGGPPPSVRGGGGYMPGPPSFGRGRGGRFAGPPPIAIRGGYGAIRGRGGRGAGFHPYTRPRAHSFPAGVGGRGGSVHRSLYLGPKPTSPAAANAAAAPARSPAAVAVAVTTTMPGGTVSRGNKVWVNPALAQQQTKPQPQQQQPQPPAARPTRNKTWVNPQLAAAKNNGGQTQQMETA